MVFTAGQKVRALDLNQGVPLLTRAGSATSVVSSTALVNATGVVLPVEADAFYWWRCLLMFNSGTGGDLKIAWAVPTGATGRWGPVQPNAGLTAYGDATTLFVDGANTAAVIEGFLDTSTTAGSLQLRFAQNSSDGTTTTIRAETMLGLSRLPS